MPELPDNNDPAVLLARREEGQSLWELARRRLPEPQFQALWLRYAEDMSVAGIAQVLRKTQTHVKVLLFRARRVLARELKAGKVAGLPTGRVASETVPERKATVLPFVEKRDAGQGKRTVELSGAMVNSEPCGSRKGLV
jgi:RNA polymerase sigma-70 factor (ECF subfamily)